MSGVTSKTIQRGDITIEVLSQGEGPVIVILPSLGRGAEDYDEVAAGLVEKGFRILRPQPRGIGRSRGTLDNITLHDLAADIAFVIESEGRGPVVVAGHAFGNFVARMLAADRPDLVRGIAIVAGSAGWIPSGESPYDPKVQESVYKSGDLSLSDEERLGHLRRAFFAPGNDPSVWLTGWHPHTKPGQSAALRAVPEKEWFYVGRAPVLDLQAYDDTVAQRKFAHILKEQLGDRVTVVVIRNAGHALMPEQPRAVIDELSKWAATLPPTAA